MYIYMYIYIYDISSLRVKAWGKTLPKIHFKAQIY